MDQTMSNSVSHDKTPEISVVIPVHNGARWLGETLRAIYAQSYPDFEIILIDDASTDGLNQVLDECHDPRLLAVHFQRNVGVSSARNQGIELARGRYIAFCDADDLCQPQRLERQRAFLESRPEIGLCGSAFTCFDTQDRETVAHPQTDAEIRRALMWGNCFGLSTVMARTQVLKGCRFDPALSVAEDYELWTRVVASGVGAANLADSLIRYRLHPQQASRHKGAQLDHVSRRVRALYCARLLGNDAWVKAWQTDRVDPGDLALAAEKVAGYVAGRPELKAQDFRFLLAWLYQQQPRHGLLSWWRWTRIQKALHLDLDRNYRLNTALLAFLPLNRENRYFDTLIKLKR